MASRGAARALEAQRRRVRQALADARGRAARQRGFANARAAGPAAAGTPAQAGPHRALQARVRRAKLEAVGDPDRFRRLVDQAVRALERNGITVHRADGPRDALDRILALFPPGLVVKSKTNAAKEIDLAGGLARAGFTVVETDLGDRINQLNGTHSSHTLAPAASVPLERIRELLSGLAGEALPGDPDALVKVARQDLRRYFEAADYGLSGANAIAADTGTIVVVENEGNIRAVSSLPRVHIVVAGTNKVVPTLEDAFAVVQAASVFGTGQELGTYCSAISGPAPAGEPAAASGEACGASPRDGGPAFGPAAVHLILLDHGRSRAVAAGFGEAFACINCGSCLNVCPVYSVAGEAYGETLLGGIGALQTAFVEGPEAAWAAGLDLCLYCRRCVDLCPVAIDTPALTMRLKAAWRRDAPAPTLERWLCWAVAGHPLAGPARLRWLATAWSWAGRLGVAEAIRRLAGRLPHPLGALAAMLPDPPAAADLQAAALPAALPAAARGSPAGADPAGAGRAAAVRDRVQLFHGCVTSTLCAGITRAAKQVLRANGCEVSSPPGQGCCGALHLHAGDPEGARALARRNVAAFADADGRPVVVTAAGCGAVLKEYGHLLRDDPAWAGRAEAFGRRVRDATEYLAGLGPVPPPRPAPEAVTYQDPCHLAVAQGVTDAPRALLALVEGLELREMDRWEACCGAAGTYYLRQWETSMALLDAKLDAALATGATVIATANPGCGMHLALGLRRRGLEGRVRVRHVLEILADAYGAGAP